MRSSSIDLSFMFVEPVFLSPAPGGAGLACPRTTGHSARIKAKGAKSINLFIYTFLKTGERP